MGLKQHYVIIIIIIIIIIKCYYSQARSSVPPKIPSINFFIRKLSLLAVVDFRFISTFLHA